MSDGRANNGGKRLGQGRPSKSEEQNLVENIHRFINRDEALLLLKEMMFEKKDIKALVLYLNYVYGKPKETRDITINQEQPLFLLDDDGELQ